jgi:hypothetical protein
LRLVFFFLGIQRVNPNLYVFYVTEGGDTTITGGIDNPNLTLGEDETITVANPDRNNVL